MCIWLIAAKIEEKVCPAARQLAEELNLQGINAKSGSMAQLNKPGEGEYGSFYAGYVSLVPAEGILKILRDQKLAYRSLIESFPEGRRFDSYGAGKWSIAQVCNHINDSERIFCYRALALSRGEENPIPGYDHNAYVDMVDVQNRTLADLIDEFFTIRDATISFFKGMPDEYALRAGSVNGYHTSVRGLAWIMAGHLFHHMQILDQRYGPLRDRG